MKRNLKDTLVFCDMDNTLLTAKEGIPECNRTVIKLFTGMGGRFTVASGRPPESVRAALGDIRLSLPAICCNGSLLYDFSTERVLRHATLERGQATAAILEIMEKFPRVGVEVMAGAGDMYVVRANPYTHAHQVDEQLSGVACPLDAVPDGWVKVVFAGDPEMIRKVGSMPRPATTGGKIISWPPTAFITRSCPRASARLRPCGTCARCSACRSKTPSSSAIITTTSRSCRRRATRSRCPTPRPK